MPTMAILIRASCRIPAEKCSQTVFTTVVESTDGRSLNKRSEPRKNAITTHLCRLASDAPTRLPIKPHSTDELHLPRLAIQMGICHGFKEIGGNSATSQPTLWRHYSPVII